MGEIRFHPEAQAEYEDALAWYQARSLQAADRFEAEVEHALNRIITNPEMFARYDEEHRYILLRRYPYSLVFQILSTEITVIAVAHTRRRPGYWRRRA